MVNLIEVSRLPAADDNCAIAIKTLPAGTAVNYDGLKFTLPYTVLEGHRFAVRLTPAGQPLLSWGYPFGQALTDIAPGDYLCNQAALDELNGRVFTSQESTFSLPSAPNFSDQITPYTFDAHYFQPAAPLTRYPDMKTFMGYPRPGRGSAGTRNTIVLLGTSSLTAAFVRRLEEQLRPLAAGYDQIDDIVAVTHTEGAGRHNNNRELLLRTLAGFIVHPNVGAVLAVDNGDEAVTNAMLHDYMRQHDYPLQAVPHYFLSRSDSFAADLERAAAIVHGWLDEVNAAPRTAVPLNQLKIALQCGGSDAFSGVSGNPLAAWLAKEVIRYGGSANLAETDELVGAEQYILSRVRDRATAEKFLQTIDRFQTWASWHGYSAVNNPSSGNIYRGLYNIYLKSLGAAVKRDPDVRLDRVIDYAAPMTEAGFYFMDSPGNDLESVAGQVAAGCNLIFFVTGNGSITNFPFVPTVKIVTTSQRYALLSDDMDVNAGAYLDGMPLAELGRQSFPLMMAVVSGKPVAGERAGHSQVQIWRDWQQTEPGSPARLSQPQLLNGRPQAIEPAESIPPTHWQAADRINLILPTSLCAGQIARMCAHRLNAQPLGEEQGPSRFVALPHTEGCGATTQDELVDIILGYATHPLVGSCLLLEHGCEKTHNAFWRRQMLEANIDPDRFGWASIQLDGGIQTVMAKIAAWFERDLADVRPPVRLRVGLDKLSLGLATDGRLSEKAAGQLAILTQWIVSAGGSVVLPDHDQLLGQAAFLDVLKLPALPEPTLNYARQPAAAGLHIMQTPSTHWSETLTGLGATGVHMMLALVEKRPLPGHPFIPVIQAAEETAVAAAYPDDLDAILTQDSGQLWANHLFNLLPATLSGAYTPRQSRQENVDFQITRGLLGISL